jgi:hypothetical protein
VRKGKRYKPKHSILRADVAVCWKRDKHRGRGLALDARAEGVSTTMRAAAEGGRRKSRTVRA